MDDQPEQLNRRQSNGSRSICIILLIYGLLYFASTGSPQNDYRNQLLSAIKNKNKDRPALIFSALTSGQFEGSWYQDDKESNQFFLSNRKGTFNSKTNEYGSSVKNFSLELEIKNGDYIDDGVAKAVLYFHEVQNWIVTSNGSTLSAAANASINESSNTLFYYHKEKFLKAEEERNYTQVNFFMNATLVNENENEQIHHSFEVEVSEGGKIRLLFTIKRQKPYFFELLTLAVLLFFIAYKQCASVMKIFKNIFEGIDQSAHFSYWTMLIALMWDTTFCVLSFLLAFDTTQSNNNLILFIFPAFLFCLLFTNVEIRLMLQVYRARFQANVDIRTIICRFNLITYGGLIAIYPILWFFNLSNQFFMLLSLMFFPQIYTNAINGKRPDLSNSYYSEFLLTRFLIILYLKCFPYNHFQMKPNYLLGFGCIALVCCQFALLHVQKTYGSKKVLPAFLLPPLYDYSVDEPNVQENQQNLQCAICLNTLHEEAPQTYKETQGQVPLQIMRAPCGHKYHGHCLVNWMRIKMECPQCRLRLPLYQ